MDVFLQQLFAPQPRLDQLLADFDEIAAAASDGVNKAGDSRRGVCDAALQPLVRDAG